MPVMPKHLSDTTNCNGQIPLQPATIITQPSVHASDVSLHSASYNDLKADLGKGIFCEWSLAHFLLPLTASNPTLLFLLCLLLHFCITHANRGERWHSGQKNDGWRVVFLEKYWQLGTWHCGVAETIHVCKGLKPQTEMGGVAKPTKLIIGCWAGGVISGNVFIQR